MHQLPNLQTPEQRVEAARVWASRKAVSVVERVPSAPATAADPGGGRAADRLRLEQAQTVLEAAERAAEAIRRDAEEQAGRHLAHAQQQADRLTAERVRLIAQLTDELAQQSAVVRGHADQMVAALQRAIETVSGRLAQPLGQVAPPAAALPPAPAAIAAGDVPPSPAPPPSRADERKHAAMMLRATRLAIAGESHERIESILREEFGRDPSEVLARLS